MNWYDKCINIIFPSRYLYFNLDRIPRSPENLNEKNVFSFFDYQSEKGRELIYYIKKHRDPLLMDKIAKYIYNELLEEISRKNEIGFFLNPIIIPIPISNKRLKERGFNQTHDFGKKIAYYFNGRYKERLFFKNKETAKQALISQRDKRKENVKGSFTVKDKYVHQLHYHDVIIVDDLYTTGATVNEAARILLKNKVRNIIIITISH